MPAKKKVEISQQKMVEISQLVPHPNNPRKISDQQMDGLAASIELGKKFLDQDRTMLTTITVNRNGMRVLGGHQRLKALIKGGVTKIPEADITFIEVAPDSDEELAILVTLNNPEIAGDWLVDDLDRILGHLQENIGEDYQTLALDKLREKACRSKLNVKDGLTDPDEIPDLKGKVVVTGDLWTLGNHRLVCGDSTDPTVIERLMQGEKADSLVTDPPYGVDYENKVAFLTKNQMGQSKTKAKRPNHIENDIGINYREFFGGFLSLIPLKTPNTIYVFMSGTELHNVRLALEDAKFKFSTYLLWVKDHFVVGRADYNYQHEFILYGWKGTHKFYGPTNRSTIINCKRPMKSELHPTMKPVELVVTLIHDGSPVKGTVIEPFGGSGTTLIACEQTDRVCRVVEMSPEYCDVICQRFYDFTGVKPKREDGTEWPHPQNIAK